MEFLVPGRFMQPRSVGRWSEGHSLRAHAPGLAGRPRAEYDVGNENDGRALTDLCVEEDARHVPTS